MDKPSKSAERASKIIGTIGYLLVSAFIGFFYALAIITVFWALAERDWFNLVGTLACAGVICMLKTVREEIR